MAGKMAQQVKVPPAKAGGLRWIPLGSTYPLDGREDLLAQVVL